MKRTIFNAGMTWVDMLACVLIVGVLMLIVLPAWAQQANEADNRVRCASNLRAIMLGMKMYANDETRTNSYPRGRYDPKTADKPKFWTAPDAPNPYADSGPGPNDVTMILYRLLATQSSRNKTLGSATFVCPSTAAEPLKFADGKRPQDFSNFRSQANLSYSVQNPYATKEAISAGFGWNDSISADFVVAGDMNPGGEALLKLKATDAPEELRRGNSPNHGFDGQNLAYADGHVEWQSTPFAGVQQDNIYTTSGRKPAADGAIPGVEAGIEAGPADDKDTILLPVWDKAVEHPKVESLPDFRMPRRTTTQPSTRPVYRPTTRPTTGPASRPVW
jgi:prepilin-type processing-associated H-X9-DG protein